MTANAGGSKKRTSERLNVPSKIISGLYSIVYSFPGFPRPTISWYDAKDEMTSDHISNGGSHVSILSAIPFFPFSTLKLRFPCFFVPSLDRFFASSERYGREIIFENRTSSAFPIWIGKRAQRIKPFSGKKASKIR